jgi:hypothetical protein
MEGAAGLVVAMTGRGHRGRTSVRGAPVGQVRDFNGRRARQELASSAARIHLAIVGERS